MRHCPAVTCAHRQRFGRAAEYTDAPTACLDCGAALAAGPAPEPAPAAPNAPAVPRALRLRAAVTVLALAAAVALSYVPLPGTESLSDLATWAGGAGSWGLMALGVGPLLLSFALVEVIAAALPPLRRLRLAGPRGRRPLRRAALLFGLALTLLMALQTANALRGEIAGDPRWTSLLLVGGTLAALGLALVVERYGLTGGLALVALAQAVPGVALHVAASVGGALGEGGFQPKGELLLLAGAVAIPALLVSPPRWLARHVASALPLPVGGLTPVADLLLPIALAGPPLALFGLSLELPAALYELVPGTTPYLLATLGASLALGWLYNQPRRVAAVRLALGPGVEARPAAVVRAARAELGVALGITLAGLAAALLLWDQGASGTVAAPSLAALATATAVVLDLAAEWRARRALGPLVVAWELHRPYAVAPALAALTREGIPAFARSRHLRALIPLLGSWAPITLLVPPAHAARATAFLTARLGGGRARSRAAILDAFG